MFFGWDYVLKVFLSHGQKHLGRIYLLDKNIFLLSLNKKIWIDDFVGPK